MSNMEFPGMLERFFSYAKIDTQSSEESTSFPSTQKQMDLLLLSELRVHIPMHNQQPSY